MALRSSRVVVIDLVDVPRLPTVLAVVADAGAGTLDRWLLPLMLLFMTRTCSNRSMAE